MIKNIKIENTSLLFRISVLYACMKIEMNE